MSCWKWFNTVLDEAGVEVTEENRERIDKVIQDYVENNSSVGRCSAVLREAGSQIAEDKGMKRELVQRVKAAAQPEMARTAVRTR
ncbi:hypothetical protein [Methanomassiliicoccus luminyensis]|jgi:hypothetical protein|uniref:hypothetical protein n=1 Tax=Methanomassiliicoccus luminyensis TaxID=1080712 RepID=UPI000360F363|nr:hypothetical protein [Methanomassiliicoccus luminyensis]